MTAQVAVDLVAPPELEQLVKEITVDTAHITPMAQAAVVVVPAVLVTTLFAITLEVTEELVQHLHLLIQLPQQLASANSQVEIII